MHLKTLVPGTVKKEEESTIGDELVGQYGVEEGEG